MLSDSAKQTTVVLTEDGGELKDLSECGDHSIVDEVLVADDGFGDALGEVLGPAILDNEIVGNEASVVLKAHFCRAEVFVGSRNIMKQAGEIVCLMVRA